MSGHLEEVRHFVEEARHVLTYWFDADAETIEPAALLRAMHSLACALEELKMVAEPEVDEPPAAPDLAPTTPTEISQLAGALASKARPG